MNVLFVNHSKKRCGVQQFGQIVFECLNRSKLFNIDYIEVDLLSDFTKKIPHKEYEVIIYNYHIQTMGWLDNDIINTLAPYSKQICITGHDHYCDFKNVINIIPDPTYVSKGKNYGVGRIIPDIILEPRIENKLPTIGSFGFGFAQKNFDKVAELVNNDFYDSGVILRLHIPPNDFADPLGYQSSNFINLAASKLNPNIKLEATSEFLPLDKMVNWLAKNDVNIFLYDEQPGRGISSVIDLALAARQPIAISNSNMFRHINDNLDILVDNSSLKDIISREIKPLKKYYNIWSEEVVLKQYEDIILNG